MSKELKAVIDDGTREIPLVNTFGKVICKIHIRPADYSILDRLTKLEKDYPEIVKPLSEMDINPDGSAAYEQAKGVLDQVGAELKKRMNELFDMDDADAIFAKRSPFSSVNGQFFFYVVFQAISDLIVEAVQEEQELSKKRMEPYLSDIHEEPENGKNDRSAAAVSLRK